MADKNNETKANKDMEILKKMEEFASSIPGATVTPLQNGPSMDYESFAAGYNLAMQHSKEFKDYEKRVLAERKKAAKAAKKPISERILRKLGLQKIEQPKTEVKTETK